MHFEPTVESLRQYRCPEWFRDAKFGIYLHWGAYSVAERGEWYVRHMYMEGHPDSTHHRETWGHPSEFGYKDFVPLWRAEKWDPQRLVTLFKQAGARYFCPCAVHHDNFDLWDSKHHHWNSVDMGPKKDITGLWRQAALEAGLRFGVTTHMARTWSWINVNKGSDRFGPYKGVPYDGADPAYEDFYLPPHEDIDLRQGLNPPKSWRQTWLERIQDLIDNYHPDHLYLDGAIPFQGDDDSQTGLEMLAYYYNQNATWHHGKQQCVMCIKNVPNHGRYIPGVATLDIERGRADAILEDPWQTDTSIGPWGYRAGATYRSAGEIVHELVDIVSKNGNLLLNVPPKADGTLDNETEALLAEIGAWMDVNGEAIYATRPWTVCGEGPLRYTRRGKTVYAIAIDWPGPGLEWSAPSLDLEAGQVENVALVGSDLRPEWRQSREGLAIRLPRELPCEHAWAFRVTLM